MHVWSSDCWELKGQNVPVDMLCGYEAGRSPFMCTLRMHVAGTAPKLEHTKRILIHSGVVVCKSSAHDAKLKIKVIEFKLAEFHATFWGTTF